LVPSVLIWKWTIRDALGGIQTSRTASNVNIASWTVRVFGMILILKWETPCVH